jgi:hypothetical protein
VTVASHPVPGNPHPPAAWIVPAAVGWLACVVRVLSGDVGGFSGHAVGVAEVWAAFLDRVLGIELEELGQLNDAVIVRRERPPAVVTHERAGQHDLSHVQGGLR